MIVEHAFAVQRFVATALAPHGHADAAYRLHAAERDAVYYALLIDGDDTALRLLAAIRAHNDDHADDGDLAMLHAHGLHATPEPPPTPQCLRHEDCDQPGRHNAATRAAFEAGGYRDFDGWKGAAA